MTACPWHLALEETGAAPIIESAGKSCQQGELNTLRELTCPLPCTVVDEQSKKEIKDILLQYDRTLLVADPRRCEPKK